SGRWRASSTPHCKTHAIKARATTLRQSFPSFLQPRTLTEQNSAFFLGHLAATLPRAASFIGALRCGTLLNGSMPSPQIGERPQIQRRLLPVWIDPRVAGHVGDRVFVAADELAPAQAMVQHAEQPLGFVTVALHRVGNLLRRIDVKVA